MEELNRWALDFEDTVYRLLKVYMESKVSGIKVTQDEETTGTPVFPTLLIQQIGFTEAGRDTESYVIKAIRPTFQITITNKGTRGKIKDIAEYAVSFFKSKNFDVSNAVFTISKQVRTATFRVSRIIGAHENLA